MKAYLNMCIIVTCARFLSLASVTWPVIVGVGSELTPGKRQKTVTCIVIGRAQPEYQSFVIMWKGDLFFI